MKKRDKQIFNKPLGVKLAVLGALVMASIVYFTKGDSPRVRADELLIGKVKRGEFTITVDGFGILESDRHMLLTARSTATVKEILMKPGAKVSAESEIVRLENPELEQELFEATQAFELAQADYRQKSAAQDRELILESIQMIERQAYYETAKLRRIAQEKLIADHIISEMEYKSSQLQEQQLEKQLGLISDRIGQLKLLHAQSLKAEAKRVEMAKARKALVEQKVDQLVVLAGMDGVLQRLPITLGQSLAVGQEVALIGSANELKALIRVPQNQAQQVAIDQLVEIDTRRDKIMGKVVRIDPIVQDNTVGVEVAFSGALPASARPQLSIDGKIIIEKIADALYMERPANSREGTSVYLFRLEGDGNSATREAVTLGKLAGNNVQITSHAEEAARYIVSALPDSVKDKETLLIIQ